MISEQEAKDFAKRLSIQDQVILVGLLEQALAEGHAEGRLALANEFSALLKETS